MNAPAPANAIRLLVAGLALACAASSVASSAGDVYRCETRSGVVFTDGPCPAGARARPWSAESSAPAIAASGPRSARAERGAARVLPKAPAPGSVAGKTEPWLDCRQRGGSFDPASRVCQLPEDTVEHMFLAD